MYKKCLHNEGHVKRENIFRESILLFFKNKHIFEKNCTRACSEITFSKNSSYRNQSVDHFANQLTGFNMVRFFTERCFLTDFNCNHCN